MRLLLSGLLALGLALGVLARPVQAGGAGEIKIGITQFPATLNPNIDAMLAKSYVLAMTRRPMERMRGSSSHRRSESNWYSRNSSSASRPRSRSSEFRYSA